MGSASKQWNKFCVLSLLLLFPSVSKISRSQKREREEGELSGHSKSKSRADRRRAAYAEGFGEGFAKGFEEGKKAAEATAFEEGSQASKAEVAALKRQLKALTDQLEREILRADNLQHQFDIIRLEQQLYPAAPRQAREDAGNGEN